MNLTFFIKIHLGNLKSRVLDLIPNPLLQQNRRFRNKHEKDECFILGSGHSIMTQDLTKLSGRIVMTQNHFHAHKDIEVIQPAYHVIIPKYQPKDYDQNWNDWFKSMEERLPSTTQFFMGNNTKYLIDKRDQLKDRTNYINTGYNALALSNAKIDLHERIMKVPTVITQCISIALYMGFKKIYLVGFDLDQMCRLVIDRDNLRFYGNSHITDTKAERQYEEEYASSGIDWFNMWATWKQLNLLKKEAEKRNIQIINLTNGGMLNVFPRESYDKIVA